MSFQSFDFKHIYEMSRIKQQVIEIYYCYNITVLVVDIYVSAIY